MSRITPILVVVLVGNANQTYLYGYGVAVANKAQAGASRDGGRVDTFVLLPSSLGAPLPDLALYDQVWVVDLSQMADDDPNLQAGWASIEAWWASRVQGAGVILDGRVASSVAPGGLYTMGYPGSEGMDEATDVFADYYRTLEADGAAVASPT